MEHPPTNQASSQTEALIGIGASQLRQHLEAYFPQGLTLSEAKCQQFLSSYGDGVHLSAQQLATLLDSEYPLIKRDHRVVCQDMTLPMTDYFISSSHNTYLKGNQLTSQSSKEMYTQVLTAGYRCVEIDVWSLSFYQKIFQDTEQIKVTHGNTFTSEIGLPAVLEAIKQSAFVNSEYPVILSIENHLNTADQALMAQQMRHILGDHLDTEAIPPDAETFPSPSERMRKIFIKAKIGKKVEKEEGEEGVSRKGGKQEEKILLAIMKTQTSEIGNKITKTVRFLERCVLTKHEKTLHPDFAQMVTYFAAKKGRTFGESEAFHHMVSHSEATSQRQVKEKSAKYAQLTLSNMVRVYPDWWRWGSSNYDPLAHWGVGAQMVSLNVQTADLYLHLNRAHFTLNGNCGWVLKPDYLRQGQPQVPAHLCITVLSAELTCAPFTGAKRQCFKVSVHACAPGEKIEAESTKQAEGLQPRWTEELTISAAQSELLFLQFRVLSMKEQLLAQCTVANVAMNRGLSSIQLETKNGEKITGARLFVLVEDAN